MVKKCKTFQSYLLQDNSLIYEDNHLDVKIPQEQACASTCPAKWEGSFEAVVYLSNF